MLRGEECTKLAIPRWDDREVYGKQLARAQQLTHCGSWEVLVASGGVGYECCGVSTWLARATFSAALCASAREEPSASNLKQHFAIDVAATRMRRRGNGQLWITALFTMSGNMANASGRFDGTSHGWANQLKVWYEYTQM